LQDGGVVAKPWARPAISGIARANPEATMLSLLGLILTVIRIYVYILIASAILSWLIAFNVVNTRNQIVAMVAEALWRLTEPALRPIRRYMPNLGGLDISPVVLIILLWFLQSLLIEYWPRTL
jgi:YggT family protein